MLAPHLQNNLKMRPEMPKSTRKRNRKRKRRVVSDSSSSEEDTSSSSSSASTPKKTVTIPVRQPKTSVNTDTDEDEDEASSSSDESQNDSDPGEEDIDISVPTSRPAHPEPPPQRDSPSPQPNVDIPPFVPPNSPQSEQAIRDKFRKFWMASIAESFKDDLEEIRKVRPLRDVDSVSWTKRVCRWIGTESWPITAGASHRVACFWCRRVLFELCRWLCK